MKLIQAILILITASLVHTASGQCEVWTGSDNEDHLTNQHSVYRSFMKTENFADAYEPWKEVYDSAPAADGKRDFHYTDGIKIYKNRFDQETDDAKKKEYTQIITDLYDECASCYEEQVIKLAKCGDDQDCYNKRIGYLMGRKGYDMYYQLNSPYGPNMEAFQKAVDLAGNDVEYIIFAPYGAITVYQFQKGKIDKDQAREVHRTLNEIAEYNIANNEKYSAYYQQAIDAMNGSFNAIEKEIFDCDYFKAKYIDSYRDNPEPEAAKDLYNLLKARGCPTGDSDSFMVELKDKYEVWAAAENAKMKAEFEANNPAMMASKAYKGGDFDGAIAKYREAISGETDNAKKATYHFRIASILFRKLKKYNDARSEARTASILNPAYGRPFMLIGDMYATTARSCGDSWNQRLAVLAAYDKYAKAKTIDASVTDEAQGKMNKYRASYPEKQDGFMRGVKEGQTQKVGCWIGESVKVRFK